MMGYLTMMANRLLGCNEWIQQMPT